MKLYLARLPVKIRQKRWSSSMFAIACSTNSAIHEIEIFICKCVSTSSILVGSISWPIEREPQYGMLISAQNSRSSLHALEKFNKNQLYPKKCNPIFSLICSRNVEALIERAVHIVHINFRLNTSRYTSIRFRKCRTSKWWDLCWCGGSPGWSISVFRRATWGEMRSASYTTFLFRIVYFLYAASV